MGGASHTATSSASLSRACISQYAPPETSQQSGRKQPQQRHHSHRGYLRHLASPYAVIGCVLSGTSDDALSGWQSLRWRTLERKDTLGQR